MIVLSDDFGSQFYYFFTVFFSPVGADRRGYASLLCAECIRASF